MAIKGLAGRRALVTGAASGIGQAVLARLKREGVDAFSAAWLRERRHHLSGRSELGL